MRTILILSILLTLGGSALAAPEDAAAASPAVRCSIHHSSPGSTILTLQDESGGMTTSPIVRLVPIPRGATDPRVRLLAAPDAPEGAVEVAADEPIVVRGLRLLPVTITPAGDGTGKTAALPPTVEVDIRYGGDSFDDPPSVPMTRSRGFFESLRGLVPDEQIASAESADEGSYLIITDPDYASAVQPLADWKRLKGLDVIVATTQETGISPSSIHDYIQNLYDNSPNPPEYVLLVGDVDRVPAGSFSLATSDLPYVLLDGGDFFPDAYIGRLSVSNATEAQTVVAKVLSYEQTPYTGGGVEWFARGLVVGANEGSSTPVPVCQWARRELLQSGWTAVDTLYYPPWSQDPFHKIPASINRGVSIVIYRGWAREIQGWDKPTFLREDVNGLLNGWKLPAVFNFVCKNNDYGAAQPCFGEAWQRATGTTEPKGAVAFIGNSEPWSHTRFNDVGAIGTVKALQQGKRRLSDIMATFKAEWIAQFPTELHLSGEGRESVEYYYYIYNLLGDPEMEMWTAPPAAITVTHIPTIPLGANYLDVTVATAGTAEPVAGARVGITQGGNRIGTGWTDASGVAHVMGRFSSDAEPVSVVVTGAGVAPSIETVQVQAGAFLTLENSGIGTAQPVPGSIVTLTPVIRNLDAAPATGITAALTAVAGGTVIAGETSFPDLDPGAAAPAIAPLQVRVDPTAPNGTVARFLLDVASGGRHSVSDLSFAVTAADLRKETAAFDGDGVLSPGETAGLTVSVRNESSIGSGALSAVLRSRSPDLVTIADSSASYGSIAGSASGNPDHAFAVTALAEAAVGQVANFTLVLTSETGQVSEISFGLSIGAADHSAPLGPDTYGYYAYDNTDTDYPDAAPTFAYFTCSPAYGGPGTKLEINDNSQVAVDLPFAFTFYGSSYSRIAVSDNGWLSFVIEPYFDFYNWHLPNTYGTGAKVAPFWDNLDPRMLNRIQQLKGDGIYTYFDEPNHRFIVEWSRLPNINPKYSDVQTFEAILYDPAFRHTATGDGVIEFIYKQIVNNDDDRMYATVGIDNEAKDSALEYTYSNVYPQPASPIGSGLAIRFTTEKPLYRPFGLARFAANPDGQRVVLTWEPGDDRARGGYRVYRSAGGGEYRLLNAQILPASARQFDDWTADPDSAYAYRIGATDPFGRETLIGPFAYTGRDAVVRTAITARTPNPFRGSLDLTYGVALRGNASIQIFDLSGRLVRTLVDRAADPGVYSTSWDGRDQQGRELPSGMYLCKYRAGREQKSLKLMLVR